MADPRCPICYREYGTFTHDPILLPDGAPYDWDSGVENTLVEMDIGDRWYTGFQQVSELDILELQTAITTLELDNDKPSPTVFSPINISGKFQILGKHIKELREAVEGLLEYFDYTKQEYFNSDAEGNHINHPRGDKLDWTDVVENEEDWNKFQVKAIHIEDLRHYIEAFKIERFNNSPIGRVYSGVSFFGDIHNTDEGHVSWVDGDALVDRDVISFLEYSPVTPPWYNVETFQSEEGAFSSVEIQNYNLNNWAYICSTGNISSQLARDDTGLGSTLVWNQLFLPARGIQSYVPAYDWYRTTRGNYFGLITDKNDMKLDITAEYARSFSGFKASVGGILTNKYTWIYPSLQIIIKFRIDCNNAGPDSYPVSFTYTCTYESPYVIYGYGSSDIIYSPTVGIDVDNITAMHETRDILSLVSETPYTLEWDFWTTLAQHHIGTYFLGDPEHPETLIPAEWRVYQVSIGIRELTGTNQLSGAYFGFDSWLSVEYPYMKIAIDNIGVRKKG